MPFPSSMRRLRTAGLAAAGLLAACATHACAQTPCAQGRRFAVDVEGVLKRGGGRVAHLWGAENMSSSPDEGGPVTRVAFPAGSFSPGRSPVRGGAGFEFRPSATGVRSACLSYEVRFPAGFDFNKGGKLPGLFGGDDPRGCVADDKVSGFSARLMWRAGGAGELYLYAPGRNERCGASIGRGAWSFTPGAWTRIVERATVNAPGAADGAVAVWIDGRQVVDAAGLVLGTTPAPAVDGLLFATFFGGNDASWASPRDQAVEFRDMALVFLTP